MILKNKDDDWFSPRFAVLGNGPSVCCRCCCMQNRRIPRTSIHVCLCGPSVGQHLLRCGLLFVVAECWCRGIASLLIYSLGWDSEIAHSVVSEVVCFVAGLYFQVQTCSLVSEHLMFLASSTHSLAYSCGKMSLW